MKFLFYLIRHLYKYKEWYVRYNWNPEMFLSLDQAEKDIEYYRKQTEKNRDDFFKEYNIERLEISYLQEDNKRLKSEIIELKDIIQAKNLVIDKLILGNKNGNEKTES